MKTRSGVLKVTRGQTDMAKLTGTSLQFHGERAQNGKQRTLFFYTRLSFCRSEWSCQRQKAMRFKFGTTGTRLQMRINGKLCSQ